MKFSLMRLLGFLTPFVTQILLAVGLGVATIACGIGLMGTSAYLIATAALHPSVAAWGVAIIGVRCFGIARGVLRYSERLVTPDVTFRLLALMRQYALGNSQIARLLTHVQPDNNMKHILPFWDMRPGSIRKRLQVDQMNTCCGIASLGGIVRFSHT